MFDDVHSTLVGADRAEALRMWAGQRPGDDTVAAELLSLADDDTHPRVRREALTLLTKQWPHRIGTREMLLRRTGDSWAMVRRAALEHLAEHWPADSQTREALEWAATADEIHLSTTGSQRYRRVPQQVPIPDNLVRAVARARQLRQEVVAANWTGTLAGSGAAAASPAWVASSAAPAGAGDAEVDSMSTAGFDGAGFRVSEGFVVVQAPGREPVRGLLGRAG